LSLPGGTVSHATSCSPRSSNVTQRAQVPRLVSAAGEGNGDSPADAFLRVVLDGAAQYEHALIAGRR
jgi:hypothetical protein